ncbi:MAG: tRNA pseudouridine(38-40) synthase TruA [Gammaproteobacteria bacterium]
MTIESIALGVEYDGSAFSGFQWQPHAPSVQQALELALTRVADAPVRVAPAGRTDAGVHATGQVVAFSVPVFRPASAWVAGTNAHLPEGVRVTWAQTVDANFHPRFSAVARRYMYVFIERGSRHERASPLLGRRAIDAPKLDDLAMHKAAQVLVGEQDFSAVRGAGCQSLSAWRNVHRVVVHRAGPFVVIDIAANAFLLHMVRNIAGVLRQVGEGRRPEGWVRDLLASRDRTQGPATAPPQGLYLVQVTYPGYTFPLAGPPPMLRALGGLERF